MGGKKKYIEMVGSFMETFNWSYKTCKFPDKSSPSTYQHPTFFTICLGHSV